MPFALSPSQRWLLVLGLVTGLSGLAHVVVWLAAGQPSLVGPVTWRKPIVFGLSIGILAVSLAWVVQYLPDRASLTRQARWVTLLLLTELLLIDIQQWRGAGSHFNVATPLDAAVFQAMGVLILAAAGILAWWTWRLFTTPRPGVARERLAAARAAMVFLGVGNLLGIGLVVWGNVVLARTGLPPTVLGAAGDLKLPHALALHGLQVLPVVALLTSALPREVQRVRTVRAATLGYALVVSGLFAQALLGRAPTEMASLPMVAAVVGAGLVVATTGGAMLGRRAGWGPATEGR